MLQNVQKLPQNNHVILETRHGYFNYLQAEALFQEVAIWLKDVCPALISQQDIWRTPKIKNVMGDRDGIKSRPVVVFNWFRWTIVETPGAMLLYLATFSKPRACVQATYMSKAHAQKAHTHIFGVRRTGGKIVWNPPLEQAQGLW